MTIKVIMRNFLSILLVVILFSCSDNKQKSISELEFMMNQIAEQYVKLVLEIDLYKPGYFDAYYGIRASHRPEPGVMPRR